MDVHPFSWHANCGGAGIISAGGGGGKTGGVGPGKRKKYIILI